MPFGTMWVQNHLIIINSEEKHFHTIVEIAKIAGRQLATAKWSFIFIDNVFLPHLTLKEPPTHDNDGKSMRLWK